jgi:hypothetical protein
VVSGRHELVVCGRLVRATATPTQGLRDEFGAVRIEKSLEILEQFPGSVDHHTSPRIARRCFLLFNRPGGLGGLDLYMMTRPV